MAAFKKSVVGAPMDFDTMDHDVAQADGDESLSVGAFHI
jgi:hypothetical protein